MYRGQSQMNSWNIFARELQNVLRHYNLSISQLDDHVGIEREKVHRLSQSLSTPNSFPVLDVDEMELLKKTLNLPESDVIHLRAAILATSIEKTLMDSINQHDARAAANQIFSIIHNSLEESSEGTQGLGNTRSGGDSDAGEDASVDKVFEVAFAAIDSGNMALQLSDRLSAAKKLPHIQFAIASFEEALHALNEMPSDIRKGSRWNMWQQDVQKNLTRAQKQLSNF